MVPTVTSNYRYQPSPQNMVDMPSERYSLICYLNEPPSVISYVHKTELFQQHLNVEREQNDSFIDLSAFNLSDVDTNKINFVGTQLGQENLDAIFNRGGNISGATLVSGTNASGLHCMDRIGMDKEMAIQLIGAGANPRAVLINYLDTERSLNHTNIDIQGIDIASVDPRSIDWQGVNLEGIALPDPPELSLEDTQKLQAKFNHDLVVLLTSISQTVARLIAISTTQDHKYQNSSLVELHSPVIGYVRHFEKSIGKLTAAIKYSTGNCGEMGEITKCMIDLYLRASLIRLGYYDFAFNSFCMSAVKPVDHMVVKLQGIFRGVEKNFMIDPWSGGKAWEYGDATAYFKKMAAFWGTGGSVSFTEANDRNQYLGRPTVRSEMRVVFEQFNVKESLDAAIKNNKGNFHDNQQKFISHYISDSLNIHSMIPAP